MIRPATCSSTRSRGGPWSMGQRYWRCARKTSPREESWLPYSATPRKPGRSGRGGEGEISARCARPGGAFAGRHPSPPCLLPKPAAGRCARYCDGEGDRRRSDRKSTRLNSSHVKISYAVFCLKKKK